MKQEPKFLCEICNVDMKLEDIFNEHNRLHEGVSEFQCVYCKKQQTNKYFKAHITLHVRKLLGEKPFQCEYCGRTFFNKPNLNKHINNVHVQLRLIECDACGFKTSNKQKLGRHMISHVMLLFQISILDMNKLSISLADET